MGRSEWGFLIESNKDIEKIILLIEAHNTCPDQDQVGEDLRIHAIIKDNETGRMFICCGNGGGRWNTNRFIDESYHGQVYWPFEKPDWWNDPNEYTYCWQRNADNKNIISPFDGTEYIINQ